METTGEVASEYSIPRLWPRRIHEEDISDLLEDIEVFPSAQVTTVEDGNPKSRPSSPLPVFLEDSFYQDLSENILSEKGKCVDSFYCKDEYRTVELDGSHLGDIPARYVVHNLRKHEFPAIGVYLDKRIVPGFNYRVRPIGAKEKYLFNGRALQLEAIGRGYSRRITFKADKGNLNDNSNYFWADSSPDGFAFELEVVSPGDKFTVYDANRLPVGTLEILSNQGAQEEVSHNVLDHGIIEKTVRIRALCKVEWYEDANGELIVPLSGIAVSVKTKDEVRTKVIGATVGSHVRRGFTLRPGINNRLRHTTVKGETINDVPTVYNITGLDDNELPVIGTYVDPRIAPGFHYKVRHASNKRRPLFDGRPLALLSVGMGYGKRLTFAPDSLNSPENYFWSDSHPDGLGFEPSAVRAGMNFDIHAGELRLGEAIVFRADAPQKEISEEVCPQTGALIKHVHVDLTCHVTLDTRFDESPEPHTMRISGTAILSKSPSSPLAELLRVENIGLASQLNILFSTQWDELVFSPSKNHTPILRY